MLSMLVTAIAAQSVVGTSHTTLVLLGTGTPRPDPERFGPAAAVVVNGEAYLVDCGPGVVRRASSARAAGVDALAPIKVKHVFITHLHSDHTLGYPDLILSPWVVGRRAPLEAFGPKGLAKMTSHLLSAFSEDIELRTHGLERGNMTGYKVNVHEIQSGLIFKDKNVTVTAIPVKHGAWKHAFGYKFETADRVIVFSGDTAPSTELESAAKNADVLVHEVYASAEAAPENRPGGEEWPVYMRAYHTSAEELGAMASRCKPKLLLLVHVLNRRGTDKVLLEEIVKGGFNGKTDIGTDLAIY